MQLTNDEKRILNRLFKDVKGTTKNTMLLAVYAAKPTNDGTSDATVLITLLNGLITKISQAERPELEALFAGIPYSIDA
jgi:hypothetical protein